MKTIECYLVGLVILTSFIMEGQITRKKPVNSADYHKWHHMQKTMVSEDGKWASYKFVYDGKLDTLFLKDIKGERNYRFPQSNDGRLNKDWFSCMRDSTLQLLHLKSDKIENISSVSSLAFAQNNCVVVHINRNKEGLLIIKGNDGKQRYRFENTQQYFLNPTGTALLLFQRLDSITTVHLVSLLSGMIELVTTISTAPVVHVSWDEKEKSVAFLDKGVKSPTLFLYRSSTKTLFQVSQNGHWEGEIAYNTNQIFLINKGSELLFWTTMQQTEEQNSFVNIWNAQDDVLQITRKKHPRSRRFLCSWRPDTGVVQVFKNNEISIIAENGHLALRKDARPYLPSAKLNSDADYYIKNLVTGTESLLLNAYGAPGSLTLLPDGHSLLYFKANHWWRYCLITETHQNLTEHLSVSFVNEAFESRDKDIPIAAPLLADDGSGFLIYDTHDIWQLDGLGGSAVRLTRGQEKHQVFRVADVELTASKNPEWVLNRGKSYPANSSLLVTVRTMDYSEEGFGWLDRTKFKSIWMKSMRVDILSKVNKDVLLTTQSFDRAPELHYLEHRKNKATSIVQSNAQHNIYAWGHTESIHYTTSKGELLQGVLFYPAEYDFKKKYPMVVSIYQKKGYERHNYKNPSSYNGVGLNISNLTSKGYFILFPDITYELGNPGFSALDCVMAAVKSALKLKAIDSSNVALVGHSYGGFETNFIVTQTNFFKTAIASAGVTDFTSRYFSMSDNHGAPETWRFEYQQGRMKGSLFHYREAYRNNSPIEHVEHITTPLLTWTGEKDTQVNPYQSMEFYIALRRLGKSHIMLTYPEEGHVLIDPGRQYDLTEKMEEWLDYYLKKSAKPLWMKENYQYHSP